MTAGQILDYCMAKKGAYIDFPFDADTCCVKLIKPIFAMVFNLKDKPMLTLRCEAAAGRELRAKYPGIIVRGYHCPPVQQPYFNTMEIGSGIPDEELFDMIDRSYDYVVKKLTKKQKEELLNFQKNAR